MKKFNIHNEKERLVAKNLFDGNIVFGAKKFHQSTNRVGKKKPLSNTLIRSHAKVVNDTGTDRFQRKEGCWELVDLCPVCKGDIFFFRFSRMAIDIYQCSNCSHQFMNPRIKYSKVIELYEDDKTAADISTSAIQKDIDRIKYSYGLDVVDQLGTPAREKILDLGCGVGVMLEEADRFGWSQSVGIDVNAAYQGTYDKTKDGIQLVNANFDELNTDEIGEGYDCVTMWNVLEHLYDLDFMMSKIKKILKSNGLLLVLVPNVESLALRLFREEGSTFSWPHVSHFCAKSLRFLMDRHAFHEEHLETIITEIDNVKSYMSGEPPYSGCGDVDSLFDFITPEYLHQNMLGSRLLGVFRNVL